MTRRRTKIEKHINVSISPDTKEYEKVIRLVDFLIRMASLRAKLIQDVTDYERALWISDVPHEKGCFTQAWGRDEEIDSDTWLEVQNQREPGLPGVPTECEPWVEKATLRFKADIPELLKEISIQVKNPSWQEGSDETEYVSQSECIEDHPEIQRNWEHYVEHKWLPWTEDHNRWDSVHKVYSALFAIHQEQIRLGEEYELVLALGLLTWKVPSGQRVHRHLIVANALLGFEAQQQRFTVRPHPDGTKLRPELDMLDIEDRPTRAEESARAGLTVTENREHDNQNGQPVPLEDPWEKSILEGVLQGLAHSFSSSTSGGAPVHGEYRDVLKKTGISAAPKPIVEYAPALILRKRSAQGLTETLKKIRDSIEQGGEIPCEFRELAEIGPQGGSIPDSPNSDPGASNGEFDGEIFFPKLSNKEQREIVEKIRT